MKSYKSLEFFIKNDVSLPLPSQYGDSKITLYINASDSAKVNIDEWYGKHFESEIPLNFRNEEIARLEGFADSHKKNDIPFAMDRAFCRGKVLIRKILKGGEYVLASCDSDELRLLLKGLLDEATYKEIYERKPPKKDLFRKSRTGDNWDDYF